MSAAGYSDGFSSFDNVDAALWYVVRACDCIGSLEEEKKRKLYGYCQDILLSYVFGNDRRFYVDTADGLLTIRNTANEALTWMDAHVGGRPVTPRYGKPIEVNALWYATIRSVSAVARQLQTDRLGNGRYSISVRDAEEIGSRAQGGLRRFLSNGLWCDRIEEGIAVGEIRPNFVIACSLPVDFVGEEGMRCALDVAREELLTVQGLRTLSARSSMFKRKYQGNQIMRDLAYHQGTVWTWLLLPYARLLGKVVKDKDVLKQRLLDLVSYYREAIREGRIAGIPELWDGDRPLVPKGAPAHALSTAAIYCIEMMIEGLQEGKQNQG